MSGIAAGGVAVAFGANPRSDGAALAWSTVWLAAVSVAVLAASGRIPLRLSRTVILFLAGSGLLAAFLLRNGLYDTEPLGDSAYVITNRFTGFSWRCSRFGRCVPSK